jgi:alkylation response protein AidB-like acyl-CoA dehydrogenase
VLALARTARERGPVPALSALYRLIEPESVVVGPGGHAVAPADAARAGGVVAGDIVVLPCLAGTGVIALRGLGPPTHSRYPAWLPGLAQLRLGVSEGVLDATMAYLRRRSLLSQQLIRSVLADALAQHLLIRATLDDPQAAGIRRMLPDLHSQITAVDRSVLRLHGAAGFTTDGPGRDAYLSELLADVHQPAPSGAVGDG